MWRAVEGGLARVVRGKLPANPPKPKALTRKVADQDDVDVLGRQRVPTPNRRALGRVGHVDRAARLELLAHVLDPSSSPSSRPV